MSGSKIFEQEIHEQPRVLEALLREARGESGIIARHIAEFKPKWVIMAARGSSDNAARYAQYLFGERNGLGVGLALPSLLSLYGAKPAMRDALVIGISQSGQSPDIVRVLTEAKSQGALTVALTNDPSSPLAEAAEHCLALRAGAERAVAATKTYTTELLALAILSTALRDATSGSDDREGWAELELLPDATQRLLDDGRDGARSIAAELQTDDKLIVVGRGYNYATAFETALKIKETTYAVAEGYSPADLLHGPVAIVGPDFPILLIAPSGKAFAGISELAADLEQRGARLTAMSDDPALAPSARARLLLPKGPEWLSPIVAVIGGQLVALELTLARGLDADAPRGLRKITLTH